MSLDDYPLDRDYIDVDDPQAADVDVSDDEHPPDSDRSWTYDTSQASTLGGTNIDFLIDDESPQAHDGRARTRTTMNAGDAPQHKREQFWRLAKLNDGMHTSDRDTQNKKADNRRWIQSFCTQLDLTDYQQSRVKYLIESVNLRHMAYYSAQECILATISIVANEDDRWIRDEDGFKRLMDGIGSDAYTIRRVRDLLREKSPHLNGNDNESD